MSTRWAYVSNSGIGSIARIYCTKYPSNEEPTGEWIVVRRIGHNSLLKNVSESSFFYYSEVQSKCFAPALISSLA